MSEDNSPGSGSSVLAVIVNYNSGDDCARLLGQLAGQQKISLGITVIDSDSGDGSLARAKVVASGLSVPVHFIEPGRNVGYTGNNLAIDETGPDVFIVNPDVEVRDPHAIAGLSSILAADPGLAAVAPHIRTQRGIEYVDSLLSLDHARAHHHPTHVPSWPHPGSVHSVPWLNGAAWLLRREALREVGLLDERFFLFFEEVDWCVRASKAGWRLGLSRDISVEHRRSSSFRGTKGAFYYWRNLYLLCSKHAVAAEWKSAYLRRLLAENLRRGPLRRGETRRAWEGYRAARRGRFGPAPEDAVSGTSPQS